MYIFEFLNFIFMGVAGGSGGVPGGFRGFGGFRGVPGGFLVLQTPVFHLSFIIFKIYYTYISFCVRRRRTNPDLAVACGLKIDAMVLRDFVRTYGPPADHLVVSTSCATVSGM